MNNKTLRYNNPIQSLLRFAALIVVMMAWMMPARAQTPAEGVYYIQNNTAEHAYLWPSVVVNTDTKLHYLTTLFTTEANTTQGCGTAFDNTYSHWVVKRVDNTTFQLIHPRTNKYVVIRDKGFGDRDVWLDDLPDNEHLIQTYFTLNGSSAPYKVSPTDCFQTTTNCDLTNRTLNSASGKDKDGLGSGNNGTSTSDARVGLIQFYTNTPLWYFIPDSLSAPTISPIDEATGRITVTETNNLPEGYEFRYTISTNGTAPLNPTATSTIMTNGSLLVEAECIIKVVVERYGVVLTSIACDTLQPSRPQTPTFTVTCDNKLELSCANMTNAHIYYTVNGVPQDNPDNTCTPYTGAITLNVGDVVKAIAYNADETIHSTDIGIYTHQLAYTNVPTIEVTSASIVTITGPSGSTIYYTTSGVDPEIGASDGSGLSPVEVNYGGNMTDIRAIAQVGSLGPSCVVGVVTMGQPVVNIETDDCTEASPLGNVIVIPLPSDGSTIWYAVTAGNNSAAPDTTDRPNPYSPYTGDVVLDDLDGSNTYYTIHAYAKSSNGLFNSTIASVSHQMITGGKPVLTPPVGSSPVVGISGGVFGDVAFCSATGVATQQLTIASDGTAEYTISPEATGTLTVAFKHGDWETSCPASYVLPAAPETPTYSQDCADLLSLACATPMADIHYTTDDTETTLESPTYSAGCLDNLPFGTIIRAKAFIGFRASAELRFEYIKRHSVTPQFFVDGTTVVISVPDDEHATIYYEVSTNHNNTMPDYPNDATTGSTEYEESYTLDGITIFSAIAVQNGLLPSCPVTAVTREGYSINSADDLDKLAEHSDKYFFVFNDIDDASGYETVVKFTGVIEGNNHTISGLTTPLFDTVSGAVIHDLNLENVSVDITADNADAGAFARVAKGTSRIYNCGILGDASSVSGTRYVGGLVGLLADTARVINCFSYANINGGTHRAGIVGYNNYPSTTKANDLKTMVMNCMFYGDISTEGTSTIYPVYGGERIHNHRAANDDTGLNNYCYFYYHGDYVNHIDNDHYQGSLGAEERFLDRFEFFRLTLNSTRNMAAYYVSGDATETDLIAKWVLDKSIAPYPILKEPGYYPSIVNHDAEHAVPIDPDNVHYNEGRKLGTLTVNVQMGSGGAVFSAPTGASIPANTQLTLNITDKDFDHEDYRSDAYDFNYKKVQLPYYNQVGEGNYSNNCVVTGWKIVAISPTGTGSFTTNTNDYPDWNFVDRTCTEKDLYSKSGRVFSQGAYWEVPDGVTSITIEPYWAKAAYLSDAYYDMTYIDGTKYGVKVAGDCPDDLDGQTVYNTITDAINALSIVTNHTVYDYAVVLVGNYHQYATGSLYSTTENKPVTIMSADLDGDCEPDNTLFYYHYARQRVAPIRFDFLNMPGIGMVKRTWDASIKPEPGIFKPVGWFEITNTVVVRFGQFEYADGETNNHLGKLLKAPLILQGGVYEQFVSAHQANIPANMTDYIHVGGNSWFKNFANGCHTSNARQTPKVPISVSGGDYENFYLTGIYQPSINPNDENVVCYIDGGRYVEVAGAGMQRVDGNATWVINAADMESFFGGGTNPTQSIQGDVTTTITNSRVTEFYGGPKFGAMQTGKKVSTTATNCRFGLFFGAGFGGTAYNRVGCEDVSKETDTPPWGTYVKDHYSRGYETTHHSNNGSGSNITVNAISTSYEYEYILHSDGKQTVARFFVNFASLSLASTQDVETNLTGCEIEKFYGGGRLGTVNGNVTSTLTDCTVDGDVFGSGFSAETPDVMVMNKANFSVPPKYNRRAGVFNDAEVSFPGSNQYFWKHANSVSTGNEFEHDDVTGKDYILTTVNLDNLGAVLGNTTLTINGNRTKIGGDVYGGGALSSTHRDKTIYVNINEGTYGTVDEGDVVTGGNIYGGGKGDLASLATETDPDHSNIAVTEGNVVLKIGNDSQSANSIVINGNVYGCNNYNGSPQGDVSVDVWVTKHNSANTASNTNGGYAIANVFGGGHLADYDPKDSEGHAVLKTASVNIHGCENTIGRVFGGGDAAAAPGVVTVIDGGRFDWVFGGGNGEVIAANIGAGGSNISVHGGKIHHLFGGSNERGSIAGSMVVNIDNSSGCDEYIDEFFGGCNLVELGTVDDPVDLSTTIGCGTMFGSVYGGSNKANIYGDVTLTIAGGEIDYVYGGSKGVAVGDATYPDGLSADISGDVTLNLAGGTIHNAFGGSNILGSIDGSITVNVEDAEDPDCPLVLTDVFGGGNLAVYGGSPVVNVKHGTVYGNVYGGGNGDPTDGTQTKGSTGAPTVVIGDANPDHKAVVEGDVYGGGNAAKVTGSTTTTVQVLNKCNTEIGYVYGGGNAADVPAASVTVAGGTIHYDVFGGGHGDKASLGGVHTDKQANVDGDVSVSITGATIDRVFAGSNINGSIGGDINLSIAKSVDANCAMKIREVYGGGNMADGKAANITIGCTGNIVAGESGHVAHPENIGTSLEGIGTLYGGANQAGISNDNDIKLNINSGIINKVFGGNNTSGEIAGDITVNIEKNSDACGWYVGDVYGGGDHAYYDGTPEVNIIAGTVYRNVYGGGNDITAENKGVNGSKVEMTGGTVLGGLYGGCNTSGVVDGDIVVNINGGTIGSYDKLNTEPYPTTDVFGGGYGASTSTSGDVEVNINGGIIYGDVYGGSALGEVNASGSNTTTVNVNGGTLETKTTTGTTPGGQSYFIYHGGNVYGGGLGRKADAPNPAISAEVNGKVFVNIGSVTAWDPDKPGYTLTTAGNATIKGNIYGCNNTYGSPQDDVVVNVYQTAHTEGVDEVDDEGYALANVFGGGNEADFTATGKTTTVNIYSCDNTIQRTFGGSNAAASNSVTTMIQGGRIHEAYGGGNGEVQAANVNGSVTLAIHGGTIGQSFSGSNQNGVISETSTVTIDDAGCGGVEVEEHFCGGNYANWEGDINATIECAAGMHVKRLYGGCKQANVVAHGGQLGNVNLTVKGGTYEYIYGGSQGYINPEDATDTISADIDGSVKLNILGGTVTKAIFGGSHILGKIKGTIVVNVEDLYQGDACPLDLSEADVYGGGNQADYPGKGLSPAGNYPQVNIKNATVKNVFGGGLEAEVKGNPQIKIKKGSKIRGNVYGGGNMGEVDGDPKVIVNGKDDTPNPIE